MFNIMKILVLNSILALSLTAPADASVLSAATKLVKRSVQAPFYLAGRVYGTLAGTFIMGLEDGIQALF